jgi:hypothetical protein
MTEKMNLSTAMTQYEETKTENGIIRLLRTLLSFQTVRSQEKSSHRLQIGKE